MATNSTDESKDSTSPVREGVGGVPVAPRSFRVIVCGGRNYKDWERLSAMLHIINRETPIGLLIEGGATGADTLAGRWASVYGIAHVTVWANWEGEGKAAGYERNQRMLDLFKPDLVVAFPGGKGTANMVSLARQYGVPVQEIA